MTRGEREAYLRGVREGLPIGAAYEWHVAYEAHKHGDAGGPGEQRVEQVYGITLFLLWAGAGRQS